MARPTNKLVRGVVNFLLGGLWLKRLKKTIFLFSGIRIFRQNPSICIEIVQAVSGKRFKMYVTFSVSLEFYLECTDL